MLLKLPKHLLYHAFNFLALNEVCDIGQLCSEVHESLLTPQGDAAVWRPFCEVPATDRLSFAPAKIFSNLAAWGRLESYKALYRASKTLQKVLGFFAWGVKTHRGAMLIVSIEKSPDGHGYELQGRLMRPSPVGIGQTVLRFESSALFATPLADLVVEMLALTRRSVKAQLASRLAAGPPVGTKVQLSATSMTADTAVFASYEALLFPVSAPPLSEAPGHGGAAMFEDAPLELVLATSGDFTRGGVVICRQLPIAISAAGMAAEQERRLSLGPAAPPVGASTSTDELRRRVPGLYYGIYGPHGCEVIAVRWRGHRRLEGLKITGDHNVPAGELTFEGYGDLRSPVDEDLQCNCMFDCCCLDDTARQSVSLLGVMDARTKTAGFNYTSPSWNGGRLLFLCARSERAHVRRQMLQRRSASAAAAAAAEPETDLLHPPVGGASSSPMRAAHRSISILLVFDSPMFRKSTVLRPFSV